VLDADDRIVRVGRVLWERLPHAEPLYGPHFDEARRTGQPVEFTVFYAAEFKRIRAIPAGDELPVHVTRLRELGVTTLGTLSASLHAIASELADPSPRPPGRPTPACRTPACASVSAP
jgi:hypothetical protein